MLFSESILQLLDLFVYNKNCNSIRNVFTEIYMNMTRIAIILNDRYLIYVYILFSVYSKKNCIF